MTVTPTLIVIATARAKAGEEKKLEQALCDVAGPTRNQPGCELFSLYRSVENPATIIGFERWSSPEDHDRHLRGAHVQKLMSEMTDLLAEAPQIATYEVVNEDDLRPLFVTNSF